MSFAASLFAVTGRSVTTASNDGWESVFGVPFGGRTFAGTWVDEQTALTVSAVFRAVALISEAVAMLPIDVFQRVAEGDRPGAPTIRVEHPDHPAARLLRRPNQHMNSVDLRSAVQSHALQYGNGYVEVQRNQGGEPIALWPLFPDRTRPQPVTAGGERVIVYRTMVDGKPFDVQPPDVAHVRGLGFDGIRGYSPLALARQGIGLAKALEEFGAKFFGNEARSGGFLEHPGKLSPEAHKNLRESMEAQGGLDNAHRLKILEEGMKYNAITIAPEDAQFLLTRSFQVEEIARLYGIPLHMLQSHAKSTSWGSGIAQMSLGFLIYTVAPWLVRWEQELETKLLTEEERRGGYFIKHNVNALLRADAATRAKFYTAALNRATGWMSRNEVRALEDLNPDDVVNEGPGVPVKWDEPSPPRETDDEEPQ